MNAKPEVNETIVIDNGKEDVEKNVQLNTISLENGSTINKSEEVARQTYSEDDIEAHRAKLEELQLKQRLMEEQNKRRKEMLSKALADRYFFIPIYLFELINMRKWSFVTMIVMSHYKA